MASFGIVPAEVPRVTDVGGLAPGFRRKLDAVIADMYAAGFDPIIAETVRTRERQQFLYGFGRQYDDGRGVVTHSQDADETWHGFGAAADIISRSKQWAAPETFWRALHQIAREHGLVSGADWDNDGIMDDWDKPHIQVGPPARRSPSPRAARIVVDRGIHALWAELGVA